MTGNGGAVTGRQFRAGKWYPTGAMARSGDSRGWRWLVAGRWVALAAGLAGLAWAKGAADVRHARVTAEYGAEVARWERRFASPPARMYWRLRDLAGASSCEVEYALGLQEEGLGLAGRRDVRRMAGERVDESRAGWELELIFHRHKLAGVRLIAPAPPRPPGRVGAAVRGGIHTAWQGLAFAAPLVWLGAMLAGRVEPGRRQAFARVGLAAAGVFAVAGRVAPGAPGGWADGVTVVACGMALASLGVAGRAARLAAARRRGRCERCGYDLTGNESGTCPECGRVTWKGMRRRHEQAVEAAAVTLAVVVSDRP